MTKIALLLSVLTPVFALAQANVYGPPAPPQSETQVRVHRGSSVQIQGPQFDDQQQWQGGGDCWGDGCGGFAKPLPPPEPDEQDQAACRTAHTNIGYDQRTATKFCKSRSRVEKTLNPDFKLCVEALAKIGGSNELTPFCFYLDRNQVTQRTLGCLAQTLSVEKHSFWFLEDQQGVRNGANAQILPFNMRAVLRECKNPVQTPASKNAKVVGLAAYAANLGVPGLTEALGGLSGLTRQGANGLWSITDSKDHPVIHKFTFDVKENPTVVDMHYNGFTELKGAGDLDFEDLALLPNGELLASTEVVSEAGSHKLFGKSESPSLLVKFNSKLDKSTPLNVPEEIIPEFQTKEVACPPAPDFFGDHKDQKCFDSITKGIQFNKGLEGMSFDAPSSSVFFAPEQPLAQSHPMFGGGFNETTPFYRAKLQGNQLVGTEKWDYPLDTMNDNGISAMLALNHDDVLVLERGFDQNERRAKMKLYKIHLGTPNGHALDKQVFIDFDGLRSQVPAGFQNLDNFEGIALGPKLANGHRLLFLVSDDNFSSQQKTLLMTLEVGGLQ